jgi:oligopeptide/dipeptide ABC transporter ATP-binding protein
VTGETGGGAESHTSAATESLLEVQGLTVSFADEIGRKRVVEGVSFSIRPRETLGLVGESGCGKSVTAMSIMRLLATPPGRVEAGRILFRGRDLITLPERDIRAIRGDRISMIFQEPMTSLNPTFTVAYQITETLRIHRDVSRASAHRRARELLALVGVGAAERRLDQYPHELSGGLRQRVMIAMALACDPDLLIADEPTTALDVTIQAQILELLGRLREELGMAVLMITHDLGVVGQICDRVEVMYAGRIVEEAATAALFEHPLHPYTLGLLASVPRLGHKQPKLPAIRGMVPAPGERGPGCYFADRCARVIGRCRAEHPALTQARRRGAHTAACWNPAP